MLIFGTLLQDQFFNGLLSYKAQIIFQIRKQCNKIQTTNPDVIYTIFESSLIQSW